MSSCDFGSLLTKYFDMLIDIFKNDLGFYNEPTKCLFTATTMLYLMCGHHAISQSQQCSVENVRARMTKIKDPSGYINKSASQARKEILSKTNERMAYFVMITNSEIPHNTNASLPLQFFPGHVFVIDKQMKANGTEPLYKLYQSYINRYTLQDFSKSRFRENRKSSTNNNNSDDMLTKHMDYDYKRMKGFLTKLLRLVNSKVWDARNVKFWKDFTLVDAKYMENYQIQPYIHFCYIALPATRCKQGLFDLLQEKLLAGKVPRKYIEAVTNLVARSNAKLNSKSILMKP